MRTLAGIFLASSLVAPAAAGQTPVPVDVPPVRTYDCLRTSRPVTLDGRLDEPAWLTAHWSEDFTDILGAAGPVPALRTRLKLLWDETFLYIGVELEEPHLWAELTVRDAVIYHEHDFELFIDPDGDTHLYAELEINARGTVWDLLLVRPYRDGGPPLSGWDIRGLQAVVGLEGTLNDPRDRDRGWSIELALPWTALAEITPSHRPPRAGEIWRMNFSRVEWPLEVREGTYVKPTDPLTGRPRREENWVWSPQRAVNLHEPEYWGRVRFRDPPSDGITGPDADPEEEVRWLLRRVYYAQREHRRAHGVYTDDPSRLGLDPGEAMTLHILALPDAFTASSPAADGRGDWRIQPDGRIWRP